MRSEADMLALIVQTAVEDDRIRVVVMNGSRANPNAPRDPFQDFDIVYLVTDMAPYLNNEQWIERFGERIIYQMPEAMADPPPSGDGGFVYLMLFADGNRIDLGVYPLERLGEMVADSETILLLDKDGVVPPLPPASDRDYLPAPPTARQYADCCNEFWWVSTYVAKGLWREEITYAKALMDTAVRDQLMKMLAWYMGIRTGFQKSPGKNGKYLRRYLEPEIWEMLLKTYAGASSAGTWDALLAMCDLFQHAALRVGAQFGFEYPHGDAARARSHLLHVRGLPRDAHEIY